MAECDTCQHNKGETIKAPGTLQPFPIPPTIWTYISMDFIVGLPKSNNNSAIMVVVDHLSKYTNLFSLQHRFTTSTVAQIFMDNIFKLHAMSHSIVYDNDTTFTNTLWKYFFLLQGTQLHLSTTYHHHTDGKNEVVNKCLETFLRCFASNRHN
jgi:IS30 family transposase